MTYAFTLDISACSGCKACQAACKDKNHLPLGVLWRRVYEVTGGEWKREGAAWDNTVFSYNLSLACNHCIHPKCAGVCPVDAYSVREDGIVLLDSTKCIGCGYCAWACPYEAPQYDPAAGTMSKCDFCHDNLEANLAPACVAACPMRVLNFGEAIINKERLALWKIPAAEHPYPMPANSSTEPRLAIKPHAAMRFSEEKFVANREEVSPQRTSRWEEAPLVAFTLLIQMAVGGLWAMLWLANDANRLPLLLVGLCLGAGVLTSFAHLGAKKNAWRVLGHLGKSWLSREILFTILFGAGWLATLISNMRHDNTPIIPWLTAFVGLGLINAMSQVYRLPSVPLWNSWRTNVGFFVSVALLGVLGIIPLKAENYIPAPQWLGVGVIVIVLLIIRAVVTRTAASAFPGREIQFALILASLIGSALLFFVPGEARLFSSLVVLVIVLAEEVAGRWFFYKARGISKA